MACKIIDFPLSLSLGLTFYWSLFARLRLAAGPPPLASSVGFFADSDWRVAALPPSDIVDPPLPADCAASAMARETSLTIAAFTICKAHESVEWRRLKSSAAAHAWRGLHKRLLLEFLSRL